MTSAASVLWRDSLCRWKADSRHRNTVGWAVCDREGPGGTSSMWEYKKIREDVGPKSQGDGEGKRSIPGRAFPILLGPLWPLLITYRSSSNIYPWEPFFMGWLCLQPSPRVGLCP